MKTETEILAELDSLLAQLPDDAARERVTSLLHARHGGPRSTLTRPASPFQLDITAAPMNGLQRDPTWPPTTVWVGETRPSDEMLARGAGPHNAVCGGALPPPASGVFIHGLHQ